MSIKISIITACFNNANTIADTIQSVQLQTYLNIEHIIVDGGSTDGTQEVVLNTKNSNQVFISEKDNGIYDAFNKGIRLATGHYIGFLNADDYFAHNRVLQNMVDLLQKTGADACYANLVYVKKEATEKIVRRWNAGEYKPNSFRYGWMPPHPTFYLKNTVYAQYGTYRTDMVSAADYELMLRMIHKHKISMAYLNEVMVHMRIGGISNSSVKNRLRANAEDRLAWKLNGLQMPWFTPFLKPARKLQQFL